MTRLSIATLGTSRLDEVLALQQTVVDSLDAPELFNAESRAYLEDLILHSGMILGAMVGDRLVAYRGAKLILGGNENLGRDIGLPRRELPSVAHFDMIAVHPEFRRKGIAHRLNLQARGYMRREGKRHVLATVSPENTPSIRMFLKLGMRPAALVRKYSGRERYIMHAALEAGARDSPAPG